MPKIKTHKATAKRFRISRPKKGSQKKKKIIMRRAGQDHFNANESGKKTRNKRRDISTAKTNLKNIKKLMPYAKSKKR